MRSLMRGKYSIARSGRKIRYSPNRSKAASRTEDWASRKRSSIPKRTSACQNYKLQQRCKKCGLPGQKFRHPPLPSNQGFSEHDFAALHYQRFGVLAEFAGEVARIGLPDLVPNRETSADLQTLFLSRLSCYADKLVSHFSLEWDTRSTWT